MLIPPPVTCILLFLIIFMNGNFTVCSISQLGGSRASQLKIPVIMVKKPWSIRFSKKVIASCALIMPLFCFISSRRDEIEIFPNETRNSLTQTLKNAAVPPTFCSLSRIRRRSFPHLKDCLNFTTNLCPSGTFNLTALASYPGSGNTWLRHLIETGSGVFTGSVYFDEVLFAKGFLGEREDWSEGSTVVQKLHVKFHPDMEFQRGVLLLREPISAIRSFVSYMEAGHTGWATFPSYNKKEWPLFVVKSFKDWLNLAISWIEAPVDLLIVHYENLLDSPVKEMGRVMNFLKIKNSRIYTTCFLDSLEGSFHRKQLKPKEGPALPSLILEEISKRTEYLNALIQKHGHDPFPFHKYKYYLRMNTTE